MNLVDAIGRMEGYGVAGSLATRNNNPGNIVFGNFAKGYGATKDPNSQFAVFPDSNVGTQATSDLLASSSYSGLSLTDAISKWNGHGSNSASYANNVATWLGVASNTLVGDVLTGSHDTGVNNNNDNGNYPNSDYFNSSFFDTSTDFSQVANSSPLVIIGLTGLGALVLFRLLNR